MPRRDVISSFQFCRKIHRVLQYGCVYVHNVIYNHLSVFLRHNRILEKKFLISLNVSSFIHAIAYISEKNVRDSDQGLLRPRKHPIYGSVVDQTRIIAASCSQSVARRTHRQRYSQIGDARLNEVRPNALSRIKNKLRVCFKKLNWRFQNRWKDIKITLKYRSPL